MTKAYQKEFNNWNEFPYQKPHLEIVLWTTSTTDGKKIQIISTGSGTGDVKTRVL